jgi:hypothetical protein
MTPAQIKSAQTLAEELRAPDNFLKPLDPHLSGINWLWMAALGGALIVLFAAVYFYRQRPLARAAVSA